MVETNPLTNPQELEELESRLLRGIRGVEPRANECIQGTRTSILDDVITQTINFDGPNITCIHGAPGSGKSSISLTAKALIHRQHRLVSYFRFDRNEATTTTPTTLWRYVALGLGRRLPAVRIQLLEQLRNDTVDLDSPMDVFASLIANPLSTITGAPDSPLVTVIDALDECGGLVGHLSRDRQTVLQALRQWAQLPKHFKLLVTSRPEGDITRALSSISTFIEIPSGFSVTENPQANSSIDSSNDIRIFLENRFQATRQRFPSLPALWPGSKTINDMTHRAAGIFMWVTTAANFIDLGIDPTIRLRSIMDDTSNLRSMKPLCSLYAIVLDIAFSEIPSGGLEAEVLQSVLGIMVLAKRPLDDIEYTKLPTTEPVTQFALDGIRDGLRSVIAPGSLRFVHKSFDDFLLSEECPPKYAIRKDKSHYILTKLCLTTMREGLRFNVCGLETSSFKNVDVPDIANKVTNGISPLLSYSCLFFGDHLGLTPFDEYLMGQIQEMILDKLLFWFEAMSLLQKINRVSPSLLLILKWLHISPNDEFKDFLHDARRFIRSFGVPIAQSAPHLYISALPFAPKNSSVAKHFLSHFPWILTFDMGKPANWPSCIFTSEHHGRAVSCVAFSANEEYFVTGSTDGTICIFDSETGNLTSGPFKCDTSVCSVCFDANERQVCAGYLDGKVICWDIETGDEHLVIRPHHRCYHHRPSTFNCRFTGSQTLISAGRELTLWNGETGSCEQDCEWEHEIYGRDRIASISSDGRYIALATGQVRTPIKVWKVVNGSEIQGPFASHPQFEHPRCISALSFSVDSKFVVSGSVDGTVLVWDPSTGDTAGPLRSTGAGRISAVACSPKSHLLASTSGTVMVWNAVTHELLGRLEGHTSDIRDIALSRDGQRVLTASDDKTVRMWDVGRKGTVLGIKANQAHTPEVKSVVLSLCGKRLASLDECSIRGWDMNTRKCLFKCDTGAAYSKLIFSPDGSQVVAYSGATGRGIGVWNANTGALVSEPNLDTRIDHVAFRSTDGVLLLCSESEVVYMWNGVPQIIVKLPRIVALSPDGLTTIVRDGLRSPRHYAWSTTTLHLLPLTFADDEYVSAPLHTYSPSGQLFASLGISTVESTVRVWNMRTGGLVACFSAFPGNSYLAFSPDDRYIAHRDFGQIKFFDVRTGKRTVVPRSGHSDSISALAFSPDGQTLASGSRDCQVRIWNVANMLGLPQLPLGNWGAKASMEGGWVKDEDGKLMFWVPKDHRDWLGWPNSVPLDESETATELDVSRFRCGESWTECYSGGDSSRRVTN